MSIRAKQKFYKYAVSKGVDLANLDVDRIDVSQPLTKKRKSTFKSRASQIKEKFNYRFSFPHRDGYNDFPDIDKIEFVKP